MEEKERDWRGAILERDKFELPGDLELRRAICPSTARIIVEAELERAYDARNENEIAILLAHNLGALSGGRFKCLARESVQIYYPEDERQGAEIYGRPDLIAWDTELNCIVIIEVKVSGSSSSAILQLLLYIWAFEDRNIGGASSALKQILCNRQIPYYGLLMSAQHSYLLKAYFQKYHDWKIGYLSFFELDRAPLGTKALVALSSRLKEKE